MWTEVSVAFMSYLLELICKGTEGWELLPHTLRDVKICSCWGFQFLPWVSPVYHMHFCPFHINTNHALWFARALINSFISYGDLAIIFHCLSREKEGGLGSNWAGYMSILPPKWWWWEVKNLSLTRVVPSSRSGRWWDVIGLKKHWKAWKPCRVVIFSFFFPSSFPNMLRYQLGISFFLIFLILLLILVFNITAVCTARNCVTRNEVHL